MTTTDLKTYGDGLLERIIKAFKGFTRRIPSWQKFIKTYALTFNFVFASIATFVFGILVLWLYDIGLGVFSFIPLVILGLAIISIYCGCIVMDIMHIDYYESIPKIYLKEKIKELEEQTRGYKKNSTKRKKALLEIQIYKELLEEHK